MTKRISDIAESSETPHLHDEIWGSIILICCNSKLPNPWKDDDPGLLFRLVTLCKQFNRIVWSHVVPALRFIRSSAVDRVGPDVARFKSLRRLDLRCVSSVSDEQLVQLTCLDRLDLAWNDSITGSLHLPPPYPLFTLL